MKLCPGCNLPARPVRVWAVQDGESSGVVGLCARCTSQVGATPSPRQKKRLVRVFGKALAQPSRYWCETFSSVDEASIVAGLLGAPSMAGKALEMLGWP